MAVLFLLLMTTMTLADTQVDRKIIFHVYENIAFEELGITLPAKLDTGAQSASLSATNIRVKEQDGEDFVIFDIALNAEHQEELGLDADDLKDIKLPLEGYVRIKKRQENMEDDDVTSTKRAKIKLTTCLGSRSRTIEVNLTDRSHFKYPVLIGARALREFKALVDPEEQHITDEPVCHNSQG